MESLEEQAGIVPGITFGLYPLLPFLADSFVEGFVLHKPPYYFNPFGILYPRYQKSVASIFYGL